MLDESERRRGPRVPVMRDATVELGDGQVTATILDVGSGGISIWGPGEAPDGPIGVRLRLEEDRDPLQLTGMVVRQFESDGGSVWGLAFTDLDAASRERLMAFVDRHAEPDLAKGA